MILLSNTTQFNQMTELWIFMLCANGFESQKELSYLNQLLMSGNAFLMRPSRSTVITWAINHSIFIKLSNAKFLVLKRGFPDHKLPTGPQKRSNCARIMSTIAKTLDLLPSWGIQQLLHEPTITLTSLNLPMQGF